MPVYADTSYLVSLYTVDANTADAVAHDQRAASPPMLTSFGQFELKNAVRLKAFRREITSEQAEASLAALEEDARTGAIALTECDWPLVLAEAEKLSSQFTRLSGYRGMDVLHVAAALVLGARDFLTFDRKQAELARQAGLTIWP